ncbi:MAG TPA: hypothetical protein VES39_10190, partial [Rhodospirillales bacterium]|nr:hypothetical protein [Rhodospirillales bacterium]
AADIEAADFRLPAVWSGPPPAAVGGRWAEASGRLVVWSTDGTVIAELARDAAPPRRQALREWRRVGGTAGTLRAGTFRRFPAAAVAAPLARTLPAGLTRWLSLALPALRQRLHRALAQPPATTVDIASALLIVPGWLYVTSSHVDLVAGLEAAALPVRIAGLDRDPGWVDALGRVVLFHFE